MTTSSALGVTSSSAANLDTQAQAFRNADFLKIMLSELGNQDPLKPQETSKIVENMQKLQELANSQYEKFRADIDWAQSLLGKTVNVQQMTIDETRKQQLINQGVRPDVGYNNLDGTVTGFRQVGETVYVSVGDYDYPVDNIKQVRPQRFDPTYLANLARDLLGTNVEYSQGDGEVGKGVVTDVAYNTDGDVMLSVNGNKVLFDQIFRIGIGAT